MPAFCSSEDFMTSFSDSSSVAFSSFISDSFHSMTCRFLPSPKVCINCSSLSFSLILLSASCRLLALVLLVLLSFSSVFFDVAVDCLSVISIRFMDSCLERLALSFSAATREARATFSSDCTAVSRASYLLKSISWCFVMLGLVTTAPTMQR